MKDCATSHDAYKTARHFLESHLEFGREWPCFEMAGA
jgi:hypothetical protein